MAIAGKEDTLTNSTNVSKYIRKPTLEDVAYISCNLRPDDHREIVEGSGLNPVLSILFSGLESDTVVFNVPNGKTAGIAGVYEDGCIWMLCTPAIQDYPITFVREARKWLDKLPHPILYNWADVRNTVHLKLLKHLGFKFINVVPYGPNNLLFVEFVKLCT